MTIYEYGSAEAPKFLFIATAALEPFWAFADPIKLLAQDYQFMQLQQTDAIRSIRETLFLLKRL